MPRKTTKKKQEGQRSNDTAADEGAPPDPPPPPPASLVTLLQKNKSVLKYFQALQENLNYDVRKWKLRARRYQADSLEWKAKAEALIKAERGSRSTEKTSRSSSKKRPAHPNREEEEIEQPQKQRLRTENPFENEKSQPHSGRTSREPLTSSAESLTSKNKSKQSKDGTFPGNETAKNSLSLKQTAEDEDDWLDLASMSSDEEAEETNENRKKAPHPQQQSTLPPLSILALSSEDSEEDTEEKDEEELDGRASMPAATQKRPPLNILALSSDDDSSDDGDEYSTSWLESQFAENQQHKSSPERLPKHRNNRVLQSLKEANDSLLQLGIALIEETPSPKEDQKIEGGEEHVDTADETAQLKVIPQRRADSSVLTDLLQSIKALVRIHMGQKKEGEVPESYYPFMAKGLIPCFTPYETTSERNSPPHPAIEGMRSLSDAFHLMETYCPSLDEIEEEDLGDHNKTLILGMKDRHTMVSSLLQSLEGEICQLWPVQDRATRLVTASLHFEASDGENEVARQSLQDIHDAKIAAPTKNFPRLAALVERCFLAQLVSRMHLARQDPRALFQFFWRYLMATSPAFGIDSTPFKLPPIQSICILESILCNGIANDQGILATHWPLHETDWKFISRTVCLLVEVTETIQLIRRNSEDDRIADTARVELAAKARLEAKHPFWKDYSPLEAKDTNKMDQITEELQTRVKNLVRQTRDISPTLQPLLLPAVLITLGNTKSVDNLFTNHIQNLDTDTIPKVLACVKAKKYLEIRMIEKHRKVVLSPSTLVDGGMRLWDYSKEILKSFQQRTGEQNEFMELANLALASCLELADGESAEKVLEKCLTGLDHDSDMMGKLNASLVWKNTTLNRIETVGQAIVVRVINLERRPDRFASFLAQAAHCNLLVMRGVMNFDESHDDAHNLLHGYALDGGNGRPAEIETRLAERLGCSQEEMSSRLVQTRWRPNDLQVFDSEAPDSLEETRISPSEKACALSHISSWKGVVKSLEMTMMESNENKQSDSSIFRHPSYWRQKFQISGYARGPPLFPENDGMPPAPVCIILEDDAILVDRFTDRLQAVLEELPRDFYFCSIGYSRPKTAPLIPFSSEISIPSCIWYLTGYIVSLEGCRYLMNQLPVRGPVDSWIGLKMFGNWDNLYGHAMGVGMANNNNNKPTESSNSKKTISKKDLRKLLKFRAFCATVPLCSQKVGIVGNTSSSTGDRNWRQRDTDIVYSGNSI